MDVLCDVAVLPKKVLELLLKAGIEVHVFGDSWKTCSLRKYQNLICHDAVLGEGCLEVYAKSGFR